MRAEMLRQAAALMRERAAAASSGPWRAAEQLHKEWFGLQSEFFALGTVFERGNAEHAASWHPAVALSVALTLEQHADMHDSYDCCHEPCAALVLADIFLRSGAGAA